MTILLDTWDAEIRKLLFQTGPCKKKKKFARCPYQPKKSWTCVSILVISTMVGSIKKEYFSPDCTG
jgi:hypothetical protein